MERAFGMVFDVGFVRFFPVAFCTNGSISATTELSKRVNVSTFTRFERGLDGDGQGPQRVVLQALLVELGDGEGDGLVCCWIDRDEVRVVGVGV